MIRRSEASLARKDYLVLNEVPPFVFILKEFLAVFYLGRADFDFAVFDFRFHERIHIGAIYGA